MRFSISALARSATICGLAFLGGVATAADLSTPGFTQAQAPRGPQNTNALSIAAVVNEDVITMFDVQSRLGLYLASAGIENSPDVQQRMLPQVMDALINDHLKLQEARRLKLTTTDVEIRDSIDRIEQNNGMRPGAFRALLAQHNVDMSTLSTQIEADLDWVKVVRKELSHDTTVAPQEVKAVLARMKANQGKPERLLAEIVLPVGPGVSEQSVRELADRLVQQSRADVTKFPALARQFSQSATAALNGDLGWVVQGDLEPEVEAMVARMEPNEISDPIRTATGYHIMTMRDRRSSGTPDPRASVVTLSQIYLPNLGGRALPPERIAKLSDDIRTEIKDCTQMNKWAKDIGGPGSGPIPAVYVGGLPDKVREAITDLKPAHLSKAIEVGGARLFIMVCTRKDDTGIPSEEQIMSNLQNEKLTNAARQKLIELRRSALVDVRI